MTFSITVESSTNLDEVTNYEEIKAKVICALTDLRDNPTRVETPSIYHLDVAAMYPNIILSNRLQPDAVVTEDVCATCDFNEGPGSLCQRPMPWSWRGEYFNAKKGEHNMLLNQLEQEKFPGKFAGDAQRSFHDLYKSEQTIHLKKRVGEYSRKIYGRSHQTKIIEKESIVCQRENPFYVNTVRDFRDRRYEYKALLKQWKCKQDKAISEDDATALDEAQKLIVIYDSLQLAHKCILNSFYGYVMRKGILNLIKGARWYSMEMAGIVCLTGAKIIQLARSRVEQVGRPLELDTDGIWCMLPVSFPDTFSFSLKSGKKINISYPCVMLNHLVHDQFTNHQYQELIDPKTMTYSVRKENSIFFEVDGPYRAMILPSSLEEDKLLKKRYAVFNHDGTLAELKGFEVKRRGELKLIKNFQSSIFKVFLEGTTLEECYAQVALVSNRWLDILYTKGADLTDAELFDLVSENRSMSKSLEEYGAQKSTSISTAKRLAEFLGDQMVRDKGLNCKFIIASKPPGVPVSERAIPVAIFQSEASVKRFFLRKWLKDNSLQEVNIRDIIDWQYYLERFGGVIQKLITIPAAMQNVENPIPRVHHPDWLAKRLFNRDDKCKQKRITDIFERTTAPLITEMEGQSNTLQQGQIKDLEDFGRPTQTEDLGGKRRFGTNVVLRKKKGKIQPRKYHVPVGVIDPFDDYSGWLEQKKKVWRDQLRKRESQKDGSGIKSFFTSTTKNINQSLWQILHVAETDTPGIFRIWAIIEGVLQSMIFEVPRILFVNSRVPNDGDYVDQPDIEMTKRMRTLPRNRTALNLYEMRMKESFYRSNASMFSSMFNHNDIEGVYETQVTPLFRALLHVGCFGQLRRFAEQVDLTECLELDDLIRSSNTPLRKYLSPNSFQMMHLYRSKAGQRQQWGLFIPSISQIFSFVVDPGMNRDALPQSKRIYNESWEAKFNSSSSTYYPQNVEVKSVVLATEKEAIRSLNKVLQDIRDEGNKPIILGIQSAGGQQHLRSIGLSSVREFPNMHIPFLKGDSLFPAIGWQLFAAKRMMGQFLNLEEFIEERIALCRYADIPLCNIENDYLLFLSDLFFARRLRKADMVLWCSSSSKPDLGGSEQDDNTLSLEEFKFPEMNVPGTYDNVCIELEVWDLALNTLIQSFGQQAEENIATSSSRGNLHFLDNHFAEPEESSTSIVLNNGNNDSLHHVLVIIRAMVKKWLSEVRNEKSLIATHFLEIFHRWITSSTAFFYDPLIVSHIHNLMKRSFGSLLEEIRRLGSQIVYASFDKLVISTSKTNFKIGGSYASYLLSALSRNIQFEHLELKPVQFWDYLIWLDLYNFGGIMHIENDPESGGEDTDVDVDMKWDISSYLPPIAQDAFESTIAHFINTVQLLKASHEGDIHKELSVVLASDIKRGLYTIVGEMHKKRFSTVAANADKNIDPSMIFPSLPGSCRPLTNASLEFIKMITAIFELDNELVYEARLLKRDLLKIIGYAEFSSEAKFTNPCEPYVLSQVICGYCSHSCDLDLTRQRDNNVIREADEPVKFLVCGACSTEYDKEDIEQRLIENVHYLVCKWQLQDLRCKRCRLVKAEDMREQCAECKGSIQPVLDYNATTRQIGVLKNLALHFEMDTLQEVICLL